jgi:hypothetical protein
MKRSCPHVAYGHVLILFLVSSFTVACVAVISGIGHVLSFSKLKLFLCLTK